MFGLSNGLRRFGVWLAVVLLVGSGCGSGLGGPAAAKPNPAEQKPTAAAAQKPSEQKPAPESGAAAAKAKVVDPCSLVTAAEVQSVVGKLRSGPEPLKGPTGEILECKFVTDEGHLVTLDVHDANGWEMEKGIAEADKETVKVTGIGEEALMKTNGTNGHVLKVLRTPYVLAIQISVDYANNLELAKTIANKALGRL